MLEDRIKFAINYCKSNKLSEFEIGKYDIQEGIHIIIDEYYTKNYENVKFESHKKYVDIQYMINGVEKIFVGSSDQFDIETEYSEETDVILYKDSTVDYKIIKNDEYIILRDKDVHKPSVYIDESLYVKKAVVKVSIQ